MDEIDKGVVISGLLRVGEEQLLDGNLVAAQLAARHL